MGDACLQYSHNYRRPEGIVSYGFRLFGEPTNLRAISDTRFTPIPEFQFISIEDKGNIRSILSAWPRIDEARISVVTDGTSFPSDVTTPPSPSCFGAPIVASGLLIQNRPFRIAYLGFGRLGHQWDAYSYWEIVALCCWCWVRASLTDYVFSIRSNKSYLCRIRPNSTIPICLDLGTNNQKFLDDPLYLGLRRRRVSNEEMNEFMDEFMREMKSVFPKLIVQFEASSLATFVNHVH